MTPETAPALPSNHEAEKALLSCLLQSVDRIHQAQQDFADEHFYHPACLLLFQSLKQMVMESVPLELPAIMGWLIDRELIDKCGGPGELGDLYSFTPTAAHYSYYRDILHQKSKQRALICSLEASLVDAKGVGDGDVEPVLSGAAERLFLISKETQKRDVPFKEKILSHLDVLEARAQGTLETGIPTRWPSLNRLFGGLTPRMWLICGYPSDGKSTLAQNLVEDVLNAGFEVLWFVYEMDETEVMDRLVSSRSQVDSSKVFFPRDNPLKREEQKRMSQAVMELAQQGLHLRCEPTWTIEQMVSETRALKRRNPKLKLVVGDYLQLIPTKKDFGSRRADQVAYISRMFKRDISAANEIAAIMLSQLNDDGKVLDSRAATQDASNIMMIEPEVEADPKNKVQKRNAALFCPKNRNGVKRKRLPIRLNGSVFTFEEYHPDTVKQ